MPSIGFIISVTTEAIFVIGLYNNNSPNYFPVDMLVLGLFFVPFIIMYFQLVITRNIILKKRLRINNPRYPIEIFVLYNLFNLCVNSSRKSVV